MILRNKLLLLTVAFIVSVSFLYVISPDRGSPQENSLVKAVDTALDNLNPFRNAEPVNDFVEEYNFTLSVADLNYFDSVSKMSVQAGYKIDYASDYRRVDLEHDGKAYEVGMALFGDGTWHYQNQKKSFKIKSKQDFVDGSKKLNFILPMERTFFGPMYAKFVAERIGLDYPGYWIALVRFNDVSQGLYLVEEDWDEFFLEQNKKTGTIVLQRSENWMKDHPEGGFEIAFGSGYDFSSGVTYEVLHTTPFDLEISNMREIESDFNREIMYRVKQLYDAASVNDQNMIEELVDLEQVARAAALQLLLERTHDFCGDNLRLYYDTTTGRFGFVPRSEGGINLLDMDCGNISYQLTTCGGISAPLLKYVLSNDKVRNLRNELVQEQLESADELIEYYDELEKRYGAVFMSDITSELRSSKVSFYIDKSRRNLESNLRSLMECDLNEI